MNKKLSVILLILILISLLILPACGTDGGRISKPSPSETASNSASPSSSKNTTPSPSKSASPIPTPTLEYKRPDPSEESKVRNWYVLRYEPGDLTDPYLNFYINYANSPGFPKDYHKNSRASVRIGTPSWGARSFGGWFYFDENNNETALIFDGQYYRLPDVTQDYYLYAKWDGTIYGYTPPPPELPADTYKIDYWTNGAINNPGNLPAFTSADLYGSSIPLYTPGTLEGHAFQGWYKKEPDSYLPDYSGSPVTSINTAGDVVLCAKWINNVTGKTVGWRDEFLGDELDMRFWNYQLGDGTDFSDDFHSNGWGNSEAQWYRKECVKVNGGELTISAVSAPDRHQYNPYLSGRIMTRGKISIEPGMRIEASMKLPAANRAWPAFWMLPVYELYGGWAASGEIDIIEARGDKPAWIYNTLHFGRPAPGNFYCSAANSGLYSVLPNNGRIDDYHIYAVEWTMAGFRWFLDGVQIGKTIPNSAYTSSGSTGPSAPFDMPFYILLNLAVGSDDTPFTGKTATFIDWNKIEMNVKYVSVYKI